VRSSTRSKQVRTLIVNGEAAVRAQLHRLCADRPDLDVIAELANGSQAIDVIQTGDADLLLLDARLPDMSGFELLRSLLPEAAPATIMVTTAQDEIGQRPAGINVELLYKPVEPPLFNAAVDHAIADTAIADTAIAEAASEPARALWPPQIIGEKCGRIYFLEACEVEYLAAAGNYVVAHVGGNEFLTRATLKCVSAQLAPLGFFQIERSLLVNLRQLAHVERRDRGQYCFVMRSGARLVSSRERSGSIRALLLGATTPQRL
jgi:two-component system, LytTR family, response regulator